MDTLKTSKHYDHKHNVFLHSPERGHTIDMYQLAPKNYRNPYKSKNRKRASSNRVINRSVAPLKSAVIAPEAIEPAIQRNYSFDTGINNRVRMS